MKSVKKSDFICLVNYLSGDQEKSERVASTSITNCESSDLKAAAIEVTAIQGMNTRAEADKTYHLILSFRAGERPEATVLEAIEREVCEGLGFGEHQRVSVAHEDTDNVHLHIAINKIHPTRLTIHSPYNDHKTLGQLCEALELTYGLERDNHQARKAGSENRAADMEHHAGVESLLGWIQRECLEPMQAATSWAELQQVLKDHGLELRERGNGLVIANEAGLMVKASSVSRTFSKNQLVNKFGEFTLTYASAANGESPKKRYEACPLRSRIDTTLLFSRYQTEQQSLGTKRSQAWHTARATRDRLIEAVKCSAKLKRVTIQLAGGSRSEKKLIYSITNKQLKADLSRINEQYRRDRARLCQQHSPLQWADWLRRQATNGDLEALAALRAREGAQGLQGNTIGAKGGERIKTKINTDLDSVTKKGTLIVLVGSSAVRDDGYRLQVSRGATREGLQSALQLAIERYGSKITVNGTIDFKAEIVKAAAIARLPLTFADSALDGQRLVLIKRSAVGAGSDKPLRLTAAKEALTFIGYDAADQYIEEREQKRHKSIDIPEHKRYNETYAGLASFAGLRRIDGKPLALLKRNEVILVMPIDEKTAYRLRRLSKGDEVTCMGIGVVKTKSRSR